LSALVLQQKDSPSREMGAEDDDDDEDDDEASVGASTTFASPDSLLIVS